MTGRELIERALLRAKILTQGEPLSADEANDGLALLNEMLSNLDHDEIRLGIGAQTLSGEIPLPDNHSRALVLLLAIEAADDYGKTPPITLLTKADRAKRQLMAEYHQPPQAELDAGLTDFQANRAPYDINQG